MEWANPPQLPSLSLPEAPGLPGPVLGIPRAELPYYKPLVVPPSVLKAPAGVEGVNSDESPKKETTTPTPKPPAPITPPLPPEAQILEIPFTEVEVPMPSTIIMTTAVTTAFISVGATLIATSLFKYIVMISKPIIKQAWNKITKKKQDLSNSSSSSGQPVS